MDSTLLHVGGATVVAFLSVGILVALMTTGRPNVWPTSEPEGPRAEWAESDPLNRRIFVPGGSFRSGSDDYMEPAPEGSPFSKIDEGPRTWTVPDFWIQEHEVSNEEYARFDSTHQYPPELARHPVVGVTAGEAIDYAHFLGGQLPNEALWEYAARGPDRRVFPWGDDSPDCRRAHYLDCEVVVADPEDEPAGVDQPGPVHEAGTVEVDAKPAGRTPLGILGLAGNVREWVTPVWYDPSTQPLNRNVIRLKGGSFAHPDFFLRAASVSRRFMPDYSWDNIGFRVVWPADGQELGQRLPIGR